MVIRKDIGNKTETLSHPPPKVSFAWPWMSAHWSNCHIKKEKEQRRKRSQTRSSKVFKRKKKQMHESVGIWVKGRP